MAMTTKTPKPTEISHDDLVKFYREGEQTDNPIFAEQRSNLMLVAGNHYTKKGSKLWNRARNDKGIDRETRIRITKNHLQRICKIYENNILSYAPAAVIEPKNKSELKDQKCAELNNAVWQDIYKRHRIKQKTRKDAQDFIRIGEVFTKVYWDETKGKFLGYEQPEINWDEIDPETVEFDENGEPILDEHMPEPVAKFAGDLVYERVYGFNLLRAKEAKTIDESWFLTLRKMVDIKELKKRIGDENDERMEFVQASRDETYLVFDGNNTTYVEATDQCLVLEMFIRPSAIYPKGYFYIYTMSGILWEGELPFGLFPIVGTGFDEVPTNPRSHSIIKQLRPYQAELNRMASSAAEVSITIGQDKVYMQPGSKLTNGGTAPGVNAYTITGGTPTIVPGRTGEQWFQPIKDCIAELYQVASIAEDNMDKSNNQDPYSLLFQSIEEKKKYMLYVTKFAQYLIDEAELSLALMKEYASPDMLIPMIGRSEQVNIAEFKTTDPLNCTISVESGTEDMETKFGKQLMFNHVIQYVGNQMDPKQLGRFIRTAPYANDEQAFEDLTRDYDNGTNMLLALDRGEQFQPDENDDSSEMMKRLVSRMRKPDFRYLPAQVQQMYQMVKQKYVQIGAMQAQQIAAAAAGFIPMSGMAVVCDLYVPDPTSPNKQQRARVPYDSLVWLLQRIEKQGMSQQALAQQQQSVQAAVARQMTGGQGNGMMPNQIHPQMGQGAGQVPQPALNPQP